MTVATLTAFGGGLLKEMSNISIHIDTDIIEIAEDIHAAILHSIVKRYKGDS